MINQKYIRNFLFFLVVLLTVNVSSQNNLALDSFPDIYVKGEGYRWLTFLNKNDNRFYFVKDSTQLSDGVICFKSDPEYVTRKYYEDGIILKEENIYLNGETQSVLFYENNKKEGVFTFYYDTGEREEIKTYLNGELNGVSMWFYRSGKIGTITNYQDGKRNGKIISFYKNGQVSEELMVEDGQKKGMFIEYYENGVKAKEFNYRSMFKVGEGFYRVWHPNGKLAYQVYRNQKGEKEGVEKGFNDWGMLVYKKEWKEGKLISKEKYVGLKGLRFPDVNMNVFLSMFHVYSDDG